jgi:DNA-binding PadR family transcriptional regulator
MFHRSFHGAHGAHSHGGHARRFARGEHGRDELHPGRGRHDGYGRGGRGGLGRFFAHGDLRLVILHLIAEKPRHGYEVIKAIEERVAGAYSPSPGVIYPTLTLLEELGYVTVSAGEGAKKLHTITDEGRAYLDANRAAVDALLARMDEAGRVHGGGPAPQVVRAMENLRLALRLRLARGPLTDAQANAVAAALDAAAGSVERA